MDTDNKDIETLCGVLMTGTKLQLQYLANLLGFDYKSSSKKAELTGGLSDYICKEPDKWLRCMPQRELDLLDILAGQEKGSEYRTPIQLAPMHIVRFGFVAHRREATDSIFSLQPYLYEAVKNGLPVAKAYRAVTDYMDYEALMGGILKTYGIMENDEFMKVFMGCIGDDENYEKIAQALSFLYESMLMKTLNRRGGETFYKETAVKCKALGSVMEERRKRPEIKEYREFTREEFMRAGYNPVYPFVGKDTPAGQKLSAFMEKLGYDEVKRDIVGTLIWMLSQEGGTQAMKDAIHLFDGKVSNQSQVEELVRVVNDYMNNVPRWMFKGYSSHEVFEKFEKPHLQPLPNKMPPAGFGMGVPKVGRNDPCPCGSGLKYKNCHGKYNS